MSKTTLITLSLFYRIMFIKKNPITGETRKINTLCRGSPARPKAAVSKTAGDFTTRVQIPLPASTS